MKNSFCFMLVSLLLVSCSEDGPVQKDKNLMFRLNNSAKEGVSINDNFYTYEEESVVSEYINGNFENFLVFNENDIVSEYIDESINNDFLIKNITTDELILIKNITEEDGYFVFDAVVNDSSINGFKYYGEIFVNSSARGPIGPVAVRAVLAIAAAVIAIIEDSPLEQCKAAMNALTCAKGKSPYMEFSEGFFSTTCNVGCR